MSIIRTTARVARSLTTVPLDSGSVPRTDPVLASNKAFRAADGTDTWTARQYAEAACIGTGDPEVFFPTTLRSLAVAEALCADCPLTQECYERGVAMAAYGVWGGRLLARGRPDRLRPVGRPPTRQPGTQSEAESEAVVA